LLSSGSLGQWPLLSGFHRVSRPPEATIMGFSGCCGQLNGKRARRPAPPKLPDNPEPPGGVKVIYVGAGYAKIVGAGTGLTYVVTDYRRHFRAHPSDLPGLLSSRDFILSP